MGKQNRQRRAAKQKARAREQRRRAEDDRPTARSGFGSREQELRAYVDLRVSAALRRLSRKRVTPDEVADSAQALAQTFDSAAEALTEVVADWLVHLVEEALTGGWSPDDLARLVRRTEPDWVRAVVAALSEEGVVDDRRPGWRAQVEALGQAQPLYLGRIGDLTAALGVAAVVASAPLLDAEAWGATIASDDVSQQHPQWQRVRGLLAKAESTEFGPEAEALVAKAQELITRYALEQVAQRASTAGSSGRPSVSPVVRRLWLEPPYVRAKAALVDAVAKPNRCRTALAQTHGFVIVVGTPGDIEATEMLVTSLLLQADAALLGPQARLGGHSTSRSYRQSFLMAYAIRIGERLDEAHGTAVEESGRAASLVPALREVAQEVDEAFDDLVPHTQGRPVNINDGAGYAAGRRAADEALFDVGDHVEARLDRQLG